MRRPDTFDDKHILARHAAIYPKESELQAVQKIVSHTERALKFVSDQLLTDGDKKPNVAGKYFIRALVLYSWFCGMRESYTIANILLQTF